MTLLCAGWQAVVSPIFLTLEEVKYAFILEVLATLGGPQISLATLQGTAIFLFHHVLEKLFLTFNS